MAKKQATYGNYRLIVEDNGKISVIDGAAAAPNAMAAMRAIAAQVGFGIEPKWNTQQCGSKLIDFINSSGASAPQSAQQPAKAPEAEKAPKPAPGPKPAAAPARAEAPAASTSTAGDNLISEEEMNEILNKLEKLGRQINDLEQRLAAVEKNPGAPSAEGGQVYVVEVIEGNEVYHRDSEGYPVLLNMYSLSNERYREEVFDKTLSGSMMCFRSTTLPTIMLLSNGDIIKRNYRICDNNSESTLRDTKAFAIQEGFDIPDKCTMGSLAAVIMAQRGRNGYCMGKGTYMSGSGTTFTYSVINVESMLKGLLNDLGMSGQITVPDLRGKSGREKFDVAGDIYGRIYNNSLPPKDKIVDYFKRRVEELDKLK